MKPLLASRELSLLAQALGEAEDALSDLPLTEEVRGLQRRFSALKTVSVGVVRNVPRLTDAQRSKLIVDALILARDVKVARRGTNGTKPG